MQLNEAKIIKTWSNFITESTGVSDRRKISWMAKYCEFHTLNESTHGYVHMNPNMNVGGMGEVQLPNVEGVRDGSGDLPVTTLPMSVQVAAQTFALDLLPVVPMKGPDTILQYQEYVYEGGKLNNHPTFNTGFKSADAPVIIKSNIYSGTEIINSQLSVGDVIVGVTPSDEAKGKTRIGKKYGLADVDQNNEATQDGKKVTLKVIKTKGFLDSRAIFEVTQENPIGTGGITNWEGTSITTTVKKADETGKIVDTEVTVTLKDVDTVKALEENIYGFSGNHEESYNQVDPYTRAEGESTPANIMSLKFDTMHVAAKTIKVKAAITREQIQDLNSYGYDAVASCETALVNELTQYLNRHVINEMTELGNINVANAGFANKFYFRTNATDTPDAGYTAIDCTAGGETQGTIQRRILSKLLAGSTLISQRSRKGPGTFAIVSAGMAAAIMDVAGFVVYPLANTVNQTATSLFPIGSVAGLSIYTDPIADFNGDTVVIGRTGKVGDAGLVFMPYILCDKVQFPSEGLEGAPVCVMSSRYALVRAGQHPETNYVTLHIKCGNNMTLY